MNTFKKPSKAAGTAHSSDGEAAATTTNSVQSMPSVPTLIDDERADNESIAVDSSSSVTADERRRPGTSDVATKPASQLSESTHFDPLISGESGNLQELETLLKSTFQKPPSSDETISFSPQVSTSTDDLSDLKSMLMDMSRSLLTKMSVIENKIDEHCTQTRKINQVINQTILPSLMDLTDIIQETSPPGALDSRAQSKLATIQTRIRSTQQHSHPNEMKNLMDI